MLSRFELRRFRGLLPTLALLFAMLVPVIYGAVYLSANWDPYGRLADLPVAIVNQDRPVTYDGTEVAAGRDIETELVDGRAFGWTRTTAADAEDGLQQGRYYLVLTIPEGFSADLMSASSSDPRRANITLRRNDANGFVIGSVTGSSQTKIENAVDKAAVEAYFKAVFKNLESIRAGMQKAADGASRLADGTQTAKTGAHDLATGVASAKDGSAQLVTGATQLNDGASKLAQGASQLNQGMPALTQGASDLSTGLQQLDTGSTTLASGAHQVADGTQQLNDTVMPVLDKVIATQDTVAKDVAAINSDVQALNTQITSGTTAVGTSIDDVNAKLSALGASDPKVAASPQFKALQQAVTNASGRASTIEQRSSTIAADSATANDKVQAFVADDKARAAKQKLTSLNDGAHQVATGADQLHTGIAQADAGATKLATGVSQVSEAVGQLSTGADQLSTGSAQLKDGAVKLDDGLAQLKDGAGRLDTGLTDLANGAAQLRDGLADGLAKIPALTKDQSDRAAVVLSSPANVTMNVDNPAKVYGRGLAPLFFSIAMWVFGISGFLVMRPISGRLLAGRLHPLRLAISAWLPFGTVGVAGAGVMLAVTWALGLAPVHPLATIGLTLLTSVVFAGIAHLMRTALNLPGSAILLVWLILQLSSTGGTYPTPLLPPFFQWIHPLMPITYTIDAFRYAISGGLASRFWRDVAVLVGIGVGAMALDVLAIMGRQRFRVSDLHPPLQH